MSDEVSSHEIFDHPATSDEVQLFVDTVLWLRNEGVVRTNGGFSGSVVGEHIFDLVLTAKGFWLLEQKLTNDLTLGAALTRIRKGETTHTGLGDFIGAALGGFTKSIGS
jgi:hypothetical protein